MKAVLTFILIVIYQFAIGQPVFHGLKDITVEKGKSRLVVPIEFQVARSADPSEILELTTDAQNLQFFTIREKTITIKARNKTVTFYIVLDTNFVPKNTISFSLKFSLQKQTSLNKTIQLKVKPEPNLIYTLWDYLHDKNLKLESVTKVESNNNILTVNGYHEDNEDNVVTRKITLSQNEIFNIWQPSNFSVSLITVPIKIRPKYDSYRATAQSGLSNIGLNFSLLGLQLDRYRSDASKVTHKFALGTWLAPSVEELNAKSLRTSGLLAEAETSKQMFVTTGLTFTYSYNSLSFVVVPVGFDMPTSKLGKEWIYRGRYWWGFGIAIEPKFFASVLNK